MQNQPNLTAAPLTILTGGELISVNMRDGSTQGVVVRLMTMRELQGYMTGLDDISGFIELACAKPKGWADELAPQSVFDVDEAARRLNDPTLDRLIQRQVSAVQMMKPMLARLGSLT